VVPPDVDLPRDPDFAAKAARALDLYARIFEGEALCADEYVICADEKTSIQARCRCHPTLPPGRARLMRVEHEYERRCALAYLAAYDVHRAKAFGRTEDTTGIVPFGRLVEQVMTAEPYASAKRVFWVVDNGSSHRGQASIDRLEGQWPTLRLIHRSPTLKWRSATSSATWSTPPCPGPASTGGVEGLSFWLPSGSSSCRSPWPWRHCWP
jgi:hypothetical protein